MRIFVGTSGWFYSWNEGGDFKWYVRNSRLNAVELNASFYRFPFPSQVNSWAKFGDRLAWSVKVNRFITHVFRLNERAYRTWAKFRRLFAKLDPLVHFYLFQLPPSFSSRLIDRVEKFVKRTQLGERFALEVRHESWFNERCIAWAKELGITWVSIDAPAFTRKIFATSSAIYLRMHGRVAWYAHDYSESELKEVARKIAKVKAKRCYVFFNNDHAMLRNARKMKEILEAMT